MAGKKISQLTEQTTITADDWIIYEDGATGSTAKISRDNFKSNLNLLASDISDFVGGVDADSLGSIPAASYIRKDIDDSTNSFLSFNWLPTAGAHGTNKSYVDQNDANRLSVTGGALTGDLSMSGSFIHNVADPVDPDDAATKQWVESVVAAGGSNLIPVADYTELRALNSTVLADAYTSGKVVYINGDGIDYSGAGRIVNDLPTRIISSITQANPAVITTSTSHGLNDNDIIYVDGGDMVEITGYYRISELTTTTFNLQDIYDTTLVDSTLFTPYTTGGIIKNEDGGRRIAIDSNYSWHRVSELGSANLKWFDPSSDPSLALALAVNSHRSVFAPEGTYEYTKKVTVNWPDTSTNLGFTLYGEGRSSLFNISGENELLDISFTRYAVIRDIGINYTTNTLDSGKKAIKFSSSNEFLIDNVIITNTRGYGISVESSDYGSIVNSRISGTFSERSINIQSNRINVSYCTLSANQTSGYGIYTSGTGNRIENNLLAGGNIGIYTSGTYGSINYNTFQANFSVCIECTQSYNEIICNKSIYTAPDSAISLSSASADSCLIFDNDFTGSGSGIGLTIAGDHNKIGRNTWRGSWTNTYSFTGLRNIVDCDYYGTIPRVLAESYNLGGAAFIDVVFSSLDANAARPDGGYVVSTSHDVNETIYITNRSSTGFRINSSNPTSTAQVQWKVSGY